MSRLDDYRTALLAANPDVSVETLNRELDEHQPEIVTFIVDYGLGPLWHARTGRDELHASRVSAEALYLAQEQALREVDSLLNDAGIEYSLIKGGATRLLLYENPAIRACHDLDLLVQPKDKLRSASVLIEAGFTAVPDTQSIDRELVLSRGSVDLDLHWCLLRQGRLRTDPTADMLSRRRQSHGIWMLAAEDALFMLLVHPAIAKHLAGWGMGLHRVVDIIDWLRTQPFDWEMVGDRLERNGVQTTAWTTLRWVQLLARPQSPVELDAIMSELCPGTMRKAWLNLWLEKDLSARTSDAHLLRLLGFSLFLHDAPSDSARALLGRLRAHRRAAADFADFEELFGQ